MQKPRPLRLRLPLLACMSRCSFFLRKAHTVTKHIGAHKSSVRRRHRSKMHLACYTTTTEMVLRRAERRTTTRVTILSLLHRSTPQALATGLSTTNVPFARKRPTLRVNALHFGMETPLVQAETVSAWARTDASAVERYISRTRRSGEKSAGL